jgi:hypothetical protein
VIREVHRDAIVPIGNGRTRRTPRLVIRSEHEVIDQELCAAGEQVRERRRTLLCFEPIILVDAHPGQRLALARQLVAAAGELLLGLEQLEPRLQPLLARSLDVCSHW